MFRTVDFLTIIFFFISSSFFLFLFRRLISLDFSVLTNLIEYLNLIGYSMNISKECSSKSIVRTNIRYKLDRSNRANYVREFYAR